MLLLADKLLAKICVRPASDCLPLKDQPDDRNMVRLDQPDVKRVSAYSRSAPVGQTTSMATDVLYEAATILHRGICGSRIGSFPLWVFLPPRLGVNNSKVGGKQLQGLG